MRPFTRVPSISHHRSAVRTTALLAGAALLAGLAAGMWACGAGSTGAAGGPKVIVLGFDGLDHELTAELMAEGRLPNFTRLAEMGGFSPLGTSVPPQSPVAWSDFITGMDGGGHGIFDFVHRDPRTLLPYLSTSHTEDAENTLTLGSYQFPLSGGRVELLRRGQAFWEVLEEHGVETSIIRIPANFPPSGTATREISGMGTPDILGTYGTFSFYTEDLAAFEDSDVSGGKVFPVTVRDNEVQAFLQGPRNPFLVQPEKVKAEFTVYLDPDRPAAKIMLGDEEVLLEEGGWSGWVPVELDLIPTQSLSVMCRFYLKEVRPVFQLYVTPLNLDPLNPPMPISTPASYAAELAEATGRYYTQGMPEDTKALSEGVFDRSDFLTQATLSGEEYIEQYKYILSRFESGLLFYYFGHVDQVSHMMWRPMDPDHPTYDPEVDAPFADAVKQLYVQLDGVVGYTLDHLPADTLLVVMSDHGFTSWRRAFHLNAWLRDNGYLEVIDPWMENDPGLLTNVEWSRTRAYGLGINSLYVNLLGRERFGIVDEAEREPLMREMAEKLLQVIDPATGGPAVSKVYLREEEYEDRGYLEIGPDIVVGYAKGTRGSNQSSLGEVPPEVFSDVTEAWSGDHLMDHEAVPGILLTNRSLKKPASTLKNLAASILAEFGIDEFPVRAQTLPEGRDAAAGGDEANH
jgi:predicted AlkP superfamily phosphohydrolase/phosphomutase